MFTGLGGCDTPRGRGKRSEMSQWSFASPLQDQHNPHDSEPSRKYVITRQQNNMPENSAFHLPALIETSGIFSGDTCTPFDAVYHQHTGWTPVEIHLRLLSYSVYVVFVFLLTLLYLERWMIIIFLRFYFPLLFLGI